MKQKALDNDIKLGPGGNSCDRLNLFEQSHDMVLVFIVFFLILSLGHNIHWLVNDGLRRVLEEMP